MVDGPAELFDEGPVVGAGQDRQSTSTHGGFEPGLGGWNLGFSLHAELGFKVELGGGPIFADCLNDASFDPVQLVDLGVATHPEPFGSAERPR